MFALLFSSLFFLTFINYKCKLTADCTFKFREYYKISVNKVNFSKQ